MQAEKHYSKDIEHPESAINLLILKNHITDGTFEEKPHHEEIIRQSKAGENLLNETYVFESTNKLYIAA